MKRSFGLVVSAVLAIASGCTTPCDEAREVLTRQCYLDVEGETVMACEGERRAYADCILTYPDQACDYFYDPLVASGNAFDLCVRAIVPD